jgi:ATP-grasp domain-containing protein
MKALIVVNSEEDWPHQIPGAAVTTAKGYLTGSAANNSHHQQVVNLCRCDRPQDEGYYVSLIGEARGHRPLPSAKTLEDLQSNGKTAPALREIERLVAQSIPHTVGNEVQIDSYFGVDPAARNAAVSRQLFSILKAPLLRARFRSTAGRWSLEGMRALTPTEVPPEHRDALLRAATLPTSSATVYMAWTSSRYRDPCT